MRLASSLVLVMGLLACIPGFAAAQWPFSDKDPTEEAGFHESDAFFLAANAVLGGLTAGATRLFRGEDFGRGFVRGAAGGSITFAGKRISAETFAGSGLLGREFAAVGTAMVANASEGRGLLDRVVLPLGPVRLYVDRSESTRLRAVVDLPNAVLTTYAAIHPRFQLDWHTSLFSGTPVFTGLSEDSGLLGYHAAGVVLLPETPRNSDSIRATLAHEQVHVIQHDFNAVTWSRSLQGRLMEHLPGGLRLHSHLDLGLNLIHRGVMNTLVHYEQRPWEREAHALMP